ncbi:MAG: DNA repair protein RadA [Candidatus Gastranaerophilales bacterium]|nr:DNA repair protein RadA [Candidatus Gastranaerophilales bacterium]
MAKFKSKWVCQNCGYESFSYLGKCPECGRFSTFVEEIVQEKVEVKSKNSSMNIGSGFSSGYSKITEVKLDKSIRISSGMEEFDRVLGGGFVEGSLCLLAGDPGIGKSTLILQTAKNISNQDKKILYICAEESTSQVKLRANRLGADSDNIYVTQQNCLEEIIGQIDDLKPDFLVVDSIQSVYSAQILSSTGSVSQIRECTNIIMRIAKQYNITTVIIGHVTKEGNIAGPKVLEHMVDCVLNFEGEKYKTTRILRGIKNRFGAVSEVGVFNMEDSGLIEIKNPSELFLSDRENITTSGSTVIPVLEGTRCLLLEVQALTGSSPYPNPRRVARGVEYDRLLQILAVLEKRVGLNLSRQDVYINVIGGINIQEPVADLGTALAVLTSARDCVINHETVCLGEIGLNGEIRSVDNLEIRLKEAQKLGFTRAIIPKILNKTVRGRIEKINIELFEVSKITDAIKFALGV